MIRWKFTYDKDEEQDWLNEYAREGWAMRSEEHTSELQSH